MDITKVVNIAQLVTEDHLTSLPYAFYDVSISCNLGLYEKPYKTVVMRIPSTPGINYRHFAYKKIDEEYILMFDDELLLLLKTKGIYLEDGDFVMVVSHGLDSIEDRINSFSIGPKIGSILSLSVKERDHLILKKHSRMAEILNGHGLITLEKNPLITVIDNETTYMFTADNPIYLRSAWMYIDFSKITIDNVTIERSENDLTHIILYFTDSVGDKYVMRIISDYMIKYPMIKYPMMKQDKPRLTFNQIEEAFRRLPNLSADVLNLLKFIETDTIYKLEDYLKIPDSEKSSISIARFPYQLLRAMGINPHIL